MRYFLVVLLLFSLCLTGYYRGEDYFFKNTSAILHKEGAFSPEYRYFSEGRQSYIFVSRDGTEVLKLFKRAYFETPWYFALPLFPKWKAHKLQEKRKRRSYFQESYALAKALFPEETGLIFLQKEGKGKDKLAFFELKSKRVYEIDLRYAPFVIQKRGESFRTALYKVYEEGGPEALLEKIDAYFLLVKRRIEAKISDKEQNIVDNFGLLSGEVFQLDPGRYVRDESLESVVRKQEEWRGAIRQLRRWVERHFPGILHTFDERSSLVERSFV